MKRHHHLVLLTPIMDLTKNLEATSVENGLTIFYVQIVTTQIKEFHKVEELLQTILGMLTIFFILLPNELIVLFSLTLSFTACLVFKPNNCCFLRPVVLLLVFVIQ